MRNAASGQKVFTDSTPGTAHLYDLVIHIQKFSVEATQSILSARAALMEPFKTTPRKHSGKWTIYILPAK
jgi:hypothetical protein